MASDDAARGLDESVCRPLGLSLDDRQLGQLLAYESLLERWNRTYNLTAVRDHESIRRQHMADCLAIVRPVQRALERSADAAASPIPRILDVGSGGGLPGAVLAIALPKVRVECLDAVGKKVAFVRQVAAELALDNLNGVHARIQAFRPLAPFDLVVARAWTRLDEMVALTDPVLAAHGVWAAMKARSVDDEVRHLPRSVEVFHVEPLTVPLLVGERCIVWMRRTRCARTDDENAPSER